MTTPIITPELLAALEEATAEHRELNTSNYGHDDVCQMNNWGIGACEVMERAALHIRSLTERLEKAVIDQGRYNWLIHQGESFQWMNIIKVDPDDFESYEEAIDAAIAQEGKNHE